MTRVVQTVLNNILSAIRSRKEAHSGTQTNPGSLSAPPAPKLRPAEFSDYHAVIELKRRWNLIPESYENWERFWRLNPALRDSAAEPVMGWVLEAQAQLVGYLGSIPLTYFYGQRRLSAVSSTGLVVEPGYRPVTLTLIAQFYRQKTDLYLGTTLAPPVGRIARAFKCDPLPQVDYDTVLFWIIQPYPFVETVLKKLELQQPLARTACLPGAIAVGAEKFLRQRWPKAGSGILSVTQIRVDEIGDEFEGLWLKKLKEQTLLMADRGAEALRWHFTVPGDMGTTNVFCCRRNKELAGYAIARSSLNRLTGLRRTIVADMLVNQDDPDVIRTLLMAVYEQAKQLESHTLEVLGFPDSIRQICLEGKPYLRKYPATPFYYRAADPAFHQTLSDCMLWYATPFDGDTTLMP